MSIQWKIHDQHNHSCFGPESAGQILVVIGGSAGNAPRPSTPSTSASSHRHDSGFQIGYRDFATVGDSRAASAASCGRSRSVSPRGRGKGLNRYS